MITNDWLDEIQGEFKKPYYRELYQFVRDEYSNDGKTNEATKNLREPLQKGQTNPKDARQQQQQEKPKKKNNKGMKM